MAITVYRTGGRIKHSPFVKPARSCDNEKMALRRNILSDAVHYFENKATMRSVAQNNALPPYCFSAPLINRHGDNLPPALCRVGFHTPGHRPRERPTDSYRQA